MIKELRQAMEHDMGIIVKVGAGPMLGPAGTAGTLGGLWKGLGTGTGFAGMNSAVRGFANANPMGGMGLALGAGILLPRLLGMFQNLVNPPD